MSEKNRIKNSIKNVGTAFAVQALYIVVSFVVRTIFVKQLGNDYLSLNGLFTNIISLLSFAELGIGTAITCSLYRPLVEGDKDEITALMLFFQRAYRYIRIVILIIGFCLTFTLPFFITGIDESINYQLIYWLFLINTYLSYTFSYKKTLLIADQKNYIVVAVEKIFYTVQSLLQCVLLIQNHNYVLFLVIQIFSTLFGNITVTAYANRKYPYLRNKNNVKIGSQKIRAFFENIRAICLYKIGAVILNGTDNLLISHLIATAYVGVYSNFSMIIHAVNGALMQAFNSLVGTIGQYNVEHKGKDGERVFLELFLISYWIFGICSVCMATLLNPFIELWLGSNYLLDQSVVVAVVMVFYVTGVNQIPSMYRTSYGIFKQAKLLPLIAAVINVGLSILFAKEMGMFGIFAATVVAKEITFSAADPYLVYKMGFHLNPVPFYIKKVWYFLIVVLQYVCCMFIFSKLPGTGWKSFFVKSIVIFIVSSVMMLGFFLKNESFRSLVMRFKQRIKNGNSK